MSLFVCRRFYYAFVCHISFHIWASLYLMCTSSVCKTKIIFIEKKLLFKYFRASKGKWNRQCIRQMATAFDLCGHARWSIPCWTYDFLSQIECHLLDNVLWNLLWKRSTGLLLCVEKQHFLSRFVRDFVRGLQRFVFLLIAIK